MAIGVSVLLFIVLTVPSLTFTAADTTKYCIVIDAHPTTTRTILYKWDTAKSIGNTGVVTQVNLGCRSKPGIGIYAPNPIDGVPALRACLGEMQALVPAGKWSSTRIYYQGAGMRLLRNINNTMVNEIKKALRNLLATYPFEFRDEYVEVLTGANEGIDGWVMLNYLKGVIAPGSPGGTTTTGALGLGHGSTQITFAPASGAIQNGYGYQLSLYGKKYTVYSQSFPCYGLTEARRRMQAAVVKAGNYADVVNSPCHFQGDSVNVTGDYLWQAPCSSGPTGMMDRTFTLVGTSNSAECIKLVQGLFSTKSCPFSFCPFSDAYIPSLSGDFLAYRGYAYQADLVNSSSGPVTVANLNGAANTLCEWTWDRVQQYTSFNIEYAHLYCFDAKYRAELLLSGLKFPGNYKVNLKLSENGTTLSWAYGFMINTTTVIPSDTLTVRPTASSADIAFVKPALLFLLVVCSFVLE